MPTPVEIAPARGKLGILLVGLGAVSTTTIAGVVAIRKGLAKPIGSLTQMGTIRLGKRTEGRSPKISDIVPLSKLDSHTIFYSLVFAVGVFSVLIYFFFSKEQDAVTRRIARVGTWFLMVSFGAAFGFTVMGRVALLIGRLNFLILDWIYPLIGIR